VYQRSEQTHRGAPLRRRTPIHRIEPGKLRAESYIRGHGADVDLFVWMVGGVGEAVRAGLRRRILDERRRAGGPVVDGSDEVEFGCPIAPDLRVGFLTWFG
jgi:hypothetical protein